MRLHRKRFPRGAIRMPADSVRAGCSGRPFKSNEAFCSHAGIVKAQLGRSVEESVKRIFYADLQAELGDPQQMRLSRSAGDLPRIQGDLAVPCRHHTRISRPRPIEAVAIVKRPRCATSGGESE